MKRERKYLCEGFVESGESGSFKRNLKSFVVDLF